jgi:Flp pilus assembly protein TadD
LLEELNSRQGSPFNTVPETAITENSEISSQDLNAILADLRQTISKLEKKNIPDDLYASAQSLLNQGDEQGAVRELERLVQSQPTHAFAHNDLGVLYQRIGVIAKSQHHHELAVKADPANATFKKNLAGLYFAELERTDDAIFLLTETLRTNPNDIETLMGLARISLAIGQKDVASVFIQKVTELEPLNEEVRELLGQTQGNNSFFLTN